MEYCNNKKVMFKYRQMPLQQMPLINQMNLIILRLFLVSVPEAQVYKSLRFKA